MDNLMDKENNNNIIKLYKENNDGINSDDAVDKEIKKKRLSRRKIKQISSYKIIIIIYNKSLILLKKRCYYSDN